jgi:hypothetical protein
MDAFMELFRQCHHIQENKHICRVAIAVFKSAEKSSSFPLKVDVHGVLGSVHAMNFGRNQNIGRIQCFEMQQHRARVTSYQ